MDQILELSPQSTPEISDFKEATVTKATKIRSEWIVTLKMIPMLKRPMAIKNQWQPKFNKYALKDAENSKTRFQVEFDEEDGLIVENDVVENMERTIEWDTLQDTRLL